MLSGNPASLPTGIAPCRNAQPLERWLRPCSGWCGRAPLARAAVGLRPLGGQGIRGSLAGCIRTHWRHKKGGRQAIGRSLGGPSTKVHATQALVQQQAAAGLRSCHPLQSDPKDAARNRPVSPSRAASRGRPIPAIEFVALADQMASALPRGRAYLADQLRRAASSIPLNIAERAGESAAANKARF